MRFRLEALLLITLFVGAPVSATAAANSSEDVDRRIAQYVEQLGDNEYDVRQRAKQALLKAGADAFDALYQAQNHEDVEIATQAQYLISAIRGDWVRPGDPEEIPALFKDFDQKSDADRLAVIQTLAQFLPVDGLGALCRLVRFEESPLLAKQAAVAVMELDASASDWAQRAETIRRTIGRSTRPGAEWLRTYLSAHDDPAQGVTRWAKLIDAEAATLAQQPSQSHHRLVIDLLQQQIALLDRLQRPADALAAVRRILEIAPGDPREPQELGELVEWLVQRKDWTAIDELSKKFANNFEAEPLLLYILADARARQGKKDLAEQTAAKAFKLNPDKMDEHLNVGKELQDRGLVDWSDREFRHVIAPAQPATRLDQVLILLEARLTFGESLHDREKDLEAAEAFKGVVDLMEDRRFEHFIANYRNPESIKSRTNFFYAAHFAAEGDTAKQIEFLDIAIGQDPTDVDVLIALYRLPNQDEHRRENTKKLIRQAVEEGRKVIEEEPPQSATPCNQLAWLVANTEGDVDEAIRCSHKSVLLTRSSPKVAKRAGGYLDTLGRSYYAKGDFENAVRYQTEANRLEPHMQQISRQLKLFERALAEKKAAGK